MLQIWQSCSPAPCVSSTRVWSCAVSLAQCLLIVTCIVEDVLSLLGQFPLTGEGAMLTCRAVASVHTLAAHAAALLQQIIITLCSCVRHCDVTTRRPRARSTVMQRAASVTGGLTMVSVIPTQRVSG
jgi:hypothetical protein